MWKILDTGVNTAKKNMDLDAQLLEKMGPNDSPTLHLYEWEQNSATYGYFLKPEKHLNLAKAQARGLMLARRPTGGGVIFHVSDFAFSVLIPAGFSPFSLNTLDNYNFINKHVKKALKKFFEMKKKPMLLAQDPIVADKDAQHFCMAKPTIYDVMIHGRKVAGAAQRKQKQGYLHQGSIAIAIPEKKLLEEVLLPGTQVLDAMQLNTFSILDSDYTPSDLEAVRKELRHLLIESFTAI